MKDQVTKIGTELAVAAAAMSTAQKRKVGCTIVYTEPNLSTPLSVAGYNYNLRAPDGPCEDSEGKTLSSVVHAEQAAVNRFFEQGLDLRNATVQGVFVTHPPCKDCVRALQRLPGEFEVVIVNEFMKFDTDKLRYDLMPVLAEEEVVAVLTKGAKKYKPNNWRKVDDRDRYIAAAYRHMAAHRKGELLDPETGLMHLAHAATNLLFIVELSKEHHNA